MRLKPHFFLPAVLLLSGCFSGATDFREPVAPENWTVSAAETTEFTNVESLKEWWKRFNDPVLDQLVELMLTDSPDRNIAAARIREARGLRRSARSFLFPQIGASGEIGRQDTGDGPNAMLGDFYDAGFDASFEVDVFGVNRNAYSASKNQLAAMQEAYHDISLSLIAEVVRSYIDFRTAQTQYMIAKRNLESQEKTLALTQDRFRLGEAPRLDVERSSNLVNTTRASLPEFERQQENARLRLSVLTGVMPAELIPALSPEADIPGAGVQPLLLAPSYILELRPDVRAAKSNLLASTDLAESATAEIFPRFTLAAFYGMTDNALIDSATVWNFLAGTAVNLLDFGRIEGRIDAARAREVQAFEQYRKTVIAAVVEVETALNDYSKITARRESLDQAYQAANKALQLSETSYKEGEISFLDVLDAQRSANNAESSAVAARAAQAESLSRLFKSLGVY